MTDPSEVLLGFIRLEPAAEGFSLHINKEDTHLITIGALIKQKRYLLSVNGNQVRSFIFSLSLNCIQKIHLFRSHIDLDSCGISLIFFYLPQGESVHCSIQSST